MNRKQRRAGGKAGPSRDELLFALAVQHHQAGRFQEAKAMYAEVVALNPGKCGAFNNLGLIAAAEGRVGEAEALFTKSSSLKPDYVDPYNNLGNLYTGLGRYDQAAAAYEQGLRVNPGFAGTHVNLGNLLQNQGRLEDAIASYQRALLINPKLDEAYLNLGNAYNRLGRLGEAVTAYERTLALKADSVAAYNNLGAALRTLGRLDQAVERLERALRLDPNHLDTHLNLGNTLTDLGRTEEAVAHYRHILKIRPDHVDALSNLLFSLNYTDAIESPALARECREIGAQLEGRFAAARRGHDNAPDRARRLRVGYVSPDFRRHAVAFFLEPLLRAHDRSAVEVFCYAEVLVPDAVTGRLRALADHWFSTIGVSDDEVAARVRADGIDILVDLAGHSAHNRMSVFARRPAPVQATWLGYPNTTGMTSIDYRLVDAVTDPEGVADAQATETLARIEGGFLCYQPPEAPDPAPPPCLEAGFVTFGSFNNLAKLSRSTFDLWSRLLARVPTARLLIKSRFFDDADARTHFLARLAGHGVSVDRVSLMGPSADTADQFASYHQVDIALDPFPYNGTTTTCESLWMGVPVVTLAGDSHRSRVSASLLGRIGLSDLVAHDAEHYIEVAASLAADPARLTALHRELRQRVAASPLCDAPAFARAMEATYRSMWRRWCDDQSPETREPVEPLRIHLGEGAAPPGWTGVARDALGRLADDSASEIDAPHVLQRLDFAVGLPAALREMRRVLAPDGVCRISVPDLEALCRLFIDAPVDRKIAVMAEMFGDGHRSGLSHDMLTALLGQAGFRAARRVADHGASAVSLTLEVWK